MKIKLKTNKITPVFTSDELESYGFELVATPTKNIGGVNYTCKVDKIVTSTVAEKFDKIYTKDMIASIMMDQGITHVYNVNKVEWYSPEDSSVVTYVEVICKGFKVEEVEEVELNLEELLAALQNDEDEEDK
jgi:hypothetical protein